MPMKRTRAWPALLVGSALAACSPTGPAGYLDATLTLDDDVVTSGASSIGRVQVTNRGPRPIAIEPIPCPPRIRLFDHRGKQVGQPPVLCVLALSAPVVLEPGGTHVYAQRWLAQDGRGEPLAAGIYRLQAWVAPLVDDPVLTNRITVVVRAPAQ